jgi:transposase-like protein
MDTRYPRSLTDAIVYFSDYEHCRRFMVEMRWPDGIIRCPTCNSEKVTYLANQRRWKCYSKHLRPQFTLKIGTIFEDSPIGLEKWLPAMWLLANCKIGISSYELADALEVTQKTAWFMLQRLRLAMQDDTPDKMSGEIEADETFIGGLARFMHKAKKAKITGTDGMGKVAVMGLLERHAGDEMSRVRATVLRNVRRASLHANIRENVESGSEMFTDALLSYAGLDPEYAHNVIDHAEKYAEGRVHVNGIENFWSLLKRRLKGTYIAIEPYHLFRYIDERVYRFNNRKVSSALRFIGVAKSVTGRRLTYKDLIDQGPHSPQPLPA